MPWYRLRVAIVLVAQLLGCGGGDVGDDDLPAAPDAAADVCTADYAAAGWPCRVIVDNNLINGVKWP